MIKAVLFDLGDTLWPCLALCGMNPAASTKAEGFNPQGCSCFPGGPKASATFRHLSRDVCAFRRGALPGARRRGQGQALPLRFCDRKASATFGKGTLLP